jgi:hypothetical protein
MPKLIFFVIILFILVAVYYKYFGKKEPKLVSNIHKLGKIHLSKREQELHKKHMHD